MDDAPPPPNDLCFCTECLTSSLKHPTKWCSRACAEANFQAHRDEVHLPERKKLGLVVDDEATLEYLLPGSSNNSDSGQRKYRAKDIKAVTTSLEEAVKEWEGRNRVQLQGAV